MHVNKVLVFLNACHIPITCVEKDLSDLINTYPAMQQSPLQPVSMLLMLDDFSLFESCVICQQLDKHYVHEHSLFNNNAHAQAIIPAYVRRIIRLIINGLLVMPKHHPKRDA